MPDSHSLRIERRKGKTVAVDDKAGYYLELDLVHQSQLAKQLVTEMSWEILIANTESIRGLRRVSETD